MSLTTGLIAAYNFEGNSNDSVGTNNGTDTAITYSVANGKVGQGAGFNGTTSRINFTDTSAWRPTGTFSVAIWIKSTSTSQMGLISNALINTGDNSGWFIDISAATIGQTRFFIATANGTTASNSIYSTGTTYNDGSWHLIGATYDGTNMYLYMDGYSAATPVASSAVSYDTTENPILGALYVNAAYVLPFNGSMDVAILYNRALSASEHLQLYNGGMGLQYPFNTSGLFPFF